MAHGCAPRDLPADHGRCLPVPEQKNIQLLHCACRRVSTTGAHGTNTDVVTCNAKTKTDFPDILGVSSERSEGDLGTTSAEGLHLNLTISSKILTGRNRRMNVRKRMNIAT